MRKVVEKLCNAADAENLLACANHAAENDDELQKYRDRKSKLILAREALKTLQKPLGMK